MKIESELIFTWQLPEYPIFDAPEDSARSVVVQLIYAADAPEASISQMSVTKSDALSLEAPEISNSAL